MNYPHLAVEYDEPTLQIEKSRSSGPILQLRSIQFIRAVAALLVVAYHLCLFSDAHFGKIELISQLLGQGFAGVDLFFVVSGFVIAYTTLLDSKKKPTLLTYSIKRLTRIYPTYWAMCLIFWIACQVSYGAVPQSNRKLEDWLSAFFLLPAHTTIIPVSWSLSHELFFYLLIGLIIYARRLWVISAIVLGGTCYYLIVPKSGALSLWFLFCDYNLEFLGGVLIAFSFWLKPLPSLLYWLVLLLSGLCLIISPAIDPANLEERILLYGTSSMGFIFGLTGLERIRQISISSAFIKLGDASYIIYLLHPSVLALLYKFAENHPSLPLWSFICLALLLIIGVSLISITLHYRLEKPFIDRLTKWIVKKLTYPVSQIR